MKKVVIMLMAVLLVAACATLTPEEKAAREAAVKEYVKSAVVKQKYKYKINISALSSGSMPKIMALNVSLPSPLRIQVKPKSNTSQKTATILTTREALLLLKIKD